MERTSKPSPAPTNCPIASLVARHQSELAKTTEILLSEVPAEGGHATREQIARFIRAGFEAGMVTAYVANQFSLPNGVPTQGRN